MAIDTSGIRHYWPAWLLGTILLGMFVALTVMLVLSLQATVRQTDRCKLKGMEAFHVYSSGWFCIDREGRVFRPR